MKAANWGKETSEQIVFGCERIFFPGRAAPEAGNIAQPLPAQAGLRMRHTPCGYIQYSGLSGISIGRKISRPQSLPIESEIPLFRENRLRMKILCTFS